MINIARILLTIAAIQYGLIPPIVDFTESHVFHEAWPPHARFHMVWLLRVGSGLAAYVIYLVWSPARNKRGQLKIASILGAIILGGFFITTATRGLFGGELADPAHQILILGMDGNLFSFGIAAVLQIIAMAIIWVEPERR